MHNHSLNEEIYDVLTLSETKNIEISCEDSSISQSIIQQELKVERRSRQNKSSNIKAKKQKKKMSTNKKLRMDNNAHKVINPNFTTIWKQVLRKTGEVYFKHDFTSEGIQFRSLKSSKKYFYVWMVYLESLGLEIQQQAYKVFLRQSTELKIKHQECKIKLQEIQLAQKAFQLFILGKKKESIQMIYGQGIRLNFKQKKKKKQILDKIALKQSKSKSNSISTASMIDEMLEDQTPLSKYNPIQESTQVMVLEQIGQTEEPSNNPGDWDKILWI